MSADDAGCHKRPICFVMTAVACLRKEYAAQRKPRHSLHLDLSEQPENVDVDWI